MRSIDWLQLVLFVAALALITKPMGLYLDAGAGCQGQDLARPDPQTPGASHVSRDGHASGPGAGLEAVHDCHAALQPGELPFHLRHPAGATTAAAQPPGLRRAQSRPGVQHRDQLYHQHQLAKLHRRIHHVVSLADGGARHPQLRLRGHRHRHRGGTRARHCPALDQDARQLLGGSRADDLLPAGAYLRGLRGGPCVARHDSELQAVHEGQAHGALHHASGQDRRQRAAGYN